MKSTACVINGVEKQIFKDPKTDDGVKKSQKGKVYVYKSNNKIIEYLGKKQTLTQWAEEYSIASVTLRKRIIDLKWPIEKALTKKVGKYATSKG